MRGQEFFEEGQRLFMSGRIRESIDQFSQALAGGHPEVPTRLSRGAAYINTQEFDKALADLNAVLAVEPDNERAHYYRGIVLLNMEEFEKAADDFNRTIAKNPKRGPAFLGRGLALSEIGKEEEALQDFKSAVAHSTVEVESFVHSFGNTRTKFDRTMALFEGDRGSLRRVMTPDEVTKLEQWMEPEE